MDPPRTTMNHGGIETFSKDHVQACLDDPRLCCSSLESCHLPTRSQLAPHSSVFESTRSSYLVFFNVSSSRGAVYLDNVRNGKGIDLSCNDNNSELLSNTFRAETPMVV